jgi:metallo-beta-lactamase family protein
MKPNITFYGAAGEVTGSRHLLDTGQTRVLLDCGLFQGGKDADQRNAAPFPFKAAVLDAVILSHAHLDHSGMLPKLVADGFKGPIYCTRQTRELLRIMLKDAAYLQERDIEWENRRRRRAGRELVEPLYSMDDVQRTLALCKSLTYGELCNISDDLRLRFIDAGHILGSAIVEIEIHGRGNHRRIVFSGDLGNPDTQLMYDPQRPGEADWVIMESTYGNRDHQDLAKTKEELAQILAQADAAGGNVLIPAFAVGRTQEVLYHLAMLRQEGRLPQSHVFLDSPMAIEVTALYLSNLSVLDRADVARLTQHGLQSVGDALDFFYPTRTPEESMSLNRIKGGAIIIAGSGMCEGGRIRHHLKHNLWRRESQVVIVGFQAQGTLGRRLVDGAELVNIMGNEIAVKAGIHTLGGYSAHAGRSQLLAWARAIAGSPKFCLVHGEEEALKALAQEIQQSLGAQVIQPHTGQQVKL